MSIELRAGRLRVGLVPEIGGSVAYLRSGTTDLMRPLSDDALRRRDVLGSAMFPMVPYANRIAGNQFTFDDRVWRFTANNPPERFNVHGTGWRSPWRLESRDAAAAVLALDYLALEEPYSYHATQHFVLTPEGLTVAMTLINRGTRAMPFGFGQHPWFERNRDVTVSFRASQFWMEGPDGIATDPIKTPPELDFAVARPLPATWRNNDYGGWDGFAEIRFPARGFGLRIQAEPIFGHLMFYADPSKPFFCLEPQTNAVCAFNSLGLEHDSGLGVIVLEPDASTKGSISFTPFTF